MNKEVKSEEEGWETVSAREVYPGPFLQVVIEEVRSPSRREAFPWTVARRKCGSMVAPVTAEGKFVLIRQERAPVRMTLWEFPAGQVDVDSPDEADIRNAALREMREETGYELAAAGEMIPLGYYFSSQGFTDERCYMFMGKGVARSATGASHDAGEAILETREFTGEELRGMIARNEIRDANTLSIYGRMCARGLI
jgi:8-oxo-dGTP pyrophosphatase MutT (NUDIX family)